jgi:hypothetical protein
MPNEINGEHKVLADRMVAMEERVISHINHKHELLVQQLEYGKEKFSTLAEADNLLNGRLLAVEKRVWVWGGGIIVLAFLIPIAIRVLL